MYSLYTQWLSVIRRSLPEEPLTRRRNLAQLLVGMALSASVHLSKIATRLPGIAKNRSKTVRLTRFLENSKVKVGEWYEPHAKGLLEHLVACGSEIRLIVDGTKVGSGHQLLMVTVAYRRRALPLAWSWVKHKRGHSSVAKQLRLLKQVQALLPQGATVSLVGDCEFGNPSVLKQLGSWGWDYVLRQSGKDLYQDQQGCWRKLAMAVMPGESRDLGTVLLTRKHQQPTRLVAHWQQGEKDPWLLATSYPDRTSALRAYARRMWTEETYGDFKGHGFDLEATRLRDAAKLNRLTLAVCLLYLWLVAFGSKVIKLGQRHLVDRNDRRDLSVFRIGWDMLHRKLTLGELVTVFLHPSS